MIYAIPTDTCYGLACSIYDEEAFHRIYMMKWRDFDKPLAILLRNYSDLRTYTDISDAQLLFLQTYTHPFTLLVRPNENFSYPDYMDKNKYAKIAFRIAEQCISQEFQDEIPYPVFLTSANKSGFPEAYTGDEVTWIFSVWIDSLKVFDSKIPEKLPPSDIFEFIGNNLEVNYIRRNFN